MSFHFLRKSRWETFRYQHSLALMNFSQFGAIVNDNIYKLAMVFMLIDALGPGSASNILSKTGAIFVIPFLLFSSAAGVLADRISKKWILAGLKIFEVLLFGAAIIAFLFKSEIASFTLLFFLATHSAIFGPSKYGIISELVDKSAVPKANGVITSFTYLGIIVGTFLGSFLSQITGRNYVLVICLCLLFAILGLLSALSIRKTPRQNSKKKFNPLFVQEVYQTMKFCRQIPHLALSIYASAYFLFIGAFTQLNMIPYTIQALQLDEIQGGYLFLCTALGIAIGSIIAGKILKKRIELAMPCVAAFAVAICLLSLSLCSSSLSVVIISLTLLGVAGGMFIVPFDSYNQISSPDEKRGQVIGAANFLGFCGVFLSAICLYLFGKIPDCSAVVGFAILGVVTLFFGVFLVLRLSSFTLPFLAKILGKSEQKISLLNLPSLSPAIFVLADGSFSKCLRLSLDAPNTRFIFLYQKKRWPHYLANLSYSLQALPLIPDALKKIETLQNLEKNPCCLILPSQQAWPFQLN